MVGRDPNGKEDVSGQDGLWILSTWWKLQCKQREATGILLVRKNLFLKIWETKRLGNTNWYRLHTGFKANQEVPKVCWDGHRMIVFLLIVVFDKVSFHQLLSYGRQHGDFFFSIKVQTFWKTHIIWKNLPHAEDCTNLCFSESLNFKA